jgi:hypothetical protein
MTHVLMRRVSATTVRHIDQLARDQQLSREESLRRRLDQIAGLSAPDMTLANLRRAAEAAQDLADRRVMAAAWQ